MSDRPQSPELDGRHLAALERAFGNRFRLEAAPDHELPKWGMPADDAMNLVEEELRLDGDPARNLATFVTTYMEPRRRRSSRRTFIATSSTTPSTRRRRSSSSAASTCSPDLFHAPGETTGARTQGSSEAIMLGALSLKWQWRERREAASKSTDRPNLVFGGDVHVVWEKFCRYFDVEPRIVPLKRDKYTIDAEDVEPHIDENTIGVAAVLGTTFTGHSDDIVGINDLLMSLHRMKRVSTFRCTSTPPAAASYGRFSTRTQSGTSAWSACARSTSPGTSSASSTRGSAGWCSGRRATCPRTSCSMRTTWESAMPRSR